ncbi:hypothetical protein HOJ01_04200 [bacterium]|jgi:hypothetical protein|nr:hypothetical protein [bacterium]MBT6293980.1 hypothetical protein [bacterium]
MTFLNQDTHLLQQAEKLGIKLPSQEEINQKNYQEFESFIRKVRYDIFNYLDQDNFLYESHSQAQFQITMFRSSIKVQAFHLSSKIDISKYDHLVFDAISPFNFLDYVQEFKEFIPIFSMFPNRLYDSLEITIEKVEDFQEILCEFQHPEEFLETQSADQENESSVDLKFNQESQSNQEINQNTQILEDSSKNKWNFFRKIFATSIATNISKIVSNKK